MDVPLFVLYALSSALPVENILVPIAITSGLILPSSVGPQPVKLEMLRSAAFVGIKDDIVAAPTVRIFLAVPEVDIISYPSFLALAILDESVVERNK
jgi:hypothetical protein